VSDDEIRIGISSCLLGEKVRFDGGHKRNEYITKILSPFVTFVPVCPEMEMGLGAPRETLRIERDRLVTTKTGIDHTAGMTRYARRRVADLRREDLSGYVFKKDSPSCGLFRVRVYDGDRAPSRTGRGLFAKALTDALPLLPVEEEGRLNDPRLRENFLERVFAYRRVQDLLGSRWRMGDLVRFHTAEKMLVLAHEPKGYQTLGRLVARAKGMPRREVATTYRETFMRAMEKMATRGRHANVLRHMAGYFRKDLQRRDKEELSGVIHDFQKGLVPLIVPVTLIRHHVGTLGVDYLAGQTYLDPHPKELMLRNHA
jgi:uncharacterized protein YbgA (DUF1722 family)/uncharacterized protein YbbK (DUF523 family)